MGNVLHSIPLCSRGSSAAVTVEPLDLDKNNNNSLSESIAAANNSLSTSEATTVVVHQPSQPALPPPEATSTPVRPQSPTGLVNSQYSDNSSNSSHSNDVIIEDTFPIDSGLEDTEFEYSKGAISPK